MRIFPVLLCSAPLLRLLTLRQWVDLRGRVLHSCNPSMAHEPPEPRIAHSEGNTAPAQMVYLRHASVAVITALSALILLASLILITSAAPVYLNGLPSETL